MEIGLGIIFDMMHKMNDFGEAKKLVLTSIIQMQQREKKEMIQVSKSDKLKAIKESLVPYIDDRQEALPTDLNKPRFIQNCMAVLDGVQDLEKYTSASIITTMTKGAFLGLDFFQGEAYAIPYGSALSFQTSYKGEVKLVKNTQLELLRTFTLKL